MPVIKLLSPTLGEFIGTGGIRVIVNILIFFIGLSLVSELLHRLLPIKQWQTTILRYLNLGRRFD